MCAGRTRFLCAPLARVGALTYDRWMRASWVVYGWMALLVGCQVEATDDNDEGTDDGVEIDAIAKKRGDRDDRDDHCRGGRPDKVTLCHQPGGSTPHTIEVAGPAVAAHLAHGDTLGACVATICVPGAVASCYDGPAGTAGVGTCTAGTQTCNAQGTGYGACTGDVTPANETCGDGLDTDCDGAADEGCVCAPGTVASCYSGPAGTEGVGTCAAGTQACSADGTSYGACTGDVTPATDVCGDGLDTDCDGVADEGCVCAPGTTASCYSGPAGTEGVGTCAAGTQTCSADGTSYGACAGDVTPAVETCGDGLDNDCDGVVDDGCTPVCVPGPEVCGNGIDDDCDGAVDEACLGDRVWNDLNRNGVQDPGEPNVQGAVLLLRGGTTGGLVAVIASDLFGHYYFANVPNGSYYVEAIAPTGFVVTVPDSGPDALDSDFDPEVSTTSVFTFTGHDDTIDLGLYLSIQN